MNQADGFEQPTESEADRESAALHPRDDPEGVKRLGAIFICVAIGAVVVFLYRGLIQGVEVNYVNVGALAVASLIVGAGLYTRTRWGLVATMTIMAGQFFWVGYRWLAEQEPNPVGLALPAIVIGYVVLRRNVFGWSGPKKEDRAKR